MVGITYYAGLVETRDIALVLRWNFHGEHREVYPVYELFRERTYVNVRRGEEGTRSPTRRRAKRGRDKEAPVFGETKVSAWWRLVVYFQCLCVILVIVKQFTSAKLLDCLAFKFLLTL